MKKACVEVFLQENIVPSWNLKATKKLTPSKPFQKVMPPLSPFGGPSMQFDFFYSSHFNPFRPSPIVLFSIRSPRWQCNVLPFSWSNIIVERIEPRSGSKKLERFYPSFTKLFIFQCLLFLTKKFFLPFGFDFCIFPSLCKSI